MNETLTLDKILKAIGELPPAPLSARPSLFGMPVMAFDDMLAPETETFRYPGHPIVKWLAKFFRFDPDIVVVRPVKSRNAQMYMIGGNLLMSQSAYNAVCINNIVV